MCEGVNADVVKRPGECHFRIHYHIRREALRLERGEEIGASARKRVGAKKEKEGERGSSGDKKLT